MSKHQPKQQPKPRKKKRSMARFIIPFVIISLFSFTGLAIWVQLTTSIELSPTLITCFYAFCTGELWMLASIKKTKIIKDVDGDGIPDDEDPEIGPPVQGYEQGVQDTLERLRKVLNNEGDESNNG